MPQVPLPPVDDVNRPFWEGCRQGELRVQRCDRCGRLRFPPTPGCGGCGARTSTWSPVAGTGTIWSFIGPHPPVLPAFAEVPGLNVVVVQLDEDPGLRLVGNVVAGAGAAVNSLPLASLAIGQAVEVVFEAVSEEISLPRWVRRDVAA